MRDQGKTIVATSTAPGRGAIAIVRLSGPDAVAIARRIVTPFPERPRLATLAELRSPTRETSPSNEYVLAPREQSGIIDHAIVIWFAAPASYTGEDMVEFSVHGGLMVSALVVEACVVEGARPALPGEFTERAVLNGKMDLVQAEAVVDLIEARSRAAHRAAVHQLDGALSRRLSEIRDALMLVDALIAYDIDFPMEDDGALSRSRVLTACDQAIERIEQLLATLPAATLGRDGAIVVLAGPPNAGKSALLNAMIGESRVLVSDIPGTTRDAVEVLVDDSPYPLCLVDTAGLRESHDVLERMGIEVSERYLARAHVVLACGESPETVEATVRAVTPLTRGGVVRVWTKGDLSPTEDGRVDRVDHYLRVSALTRDGIDVLRHRIRAVLTEQVAPPSDDVPLITRARHEQALQVARDELREFRLAWETGTLPAPVVATHVRAAVTALESLIGAVDVEEILERVFRTFCIGK